MKKLYEFVVNWMIENEVTCEEDICQSDRVRLILEEFACDCFKLVESELPVNEE